MTTATQVRERPILCSGPMVKAILRGRKTQTRRIVKPHPPNYIDKLHWNDLRGRAPYRIEHDETGQILGNGFQDDDDRYYLARANVGDRLWVRETWARSRNNWLYRADEGDGCKPSEVVAEWDWDSGCVDKWRPSIHMPRRAARLFLEVTGVRVERLNEISREDAIAEGAFLNGNDYWEFGNGRTGTTSPQAAFADLWSILNGLESWEANPWVWVIEFKRI